MIEVDQGVRHTVDSLLGMVKTRPALVFQSLGSALETLSKVSLAGFASLPRSWGSETLRAGVGSSSDHVQLRLAYAPSLVHHNLTRLNSPAQTFG